MSKMAYFMAGAALMGVGFMFMAMEPHQCLCVDDMKDLYHDTKKDVEHCINDVRHDLKKHF